MLRCTICDTYLYDEYAVIGGKEEQPICLDCDDPVTIKEWKLENQDA
jgi:hypothetical protein